MCGACVTAAVAERMLSRRAALLGGLAAPALAAAAPFAHAQAAPSRAVDLTHTLSRDFPTFNDAPAIEARRTYEFDKTGINLDRLTFDEHVGTHLDAPLHFSANGASVDRIPVAELVCPLCVIDIREKAAADDDASLTPEDVAAWTAWHGPIPRGACVALWSGWEARLGGKRYRNADEAGVMRFPGFHPETALMLLEEGSAVGLAVDTLSLDIGSSKTFDTHYTWLPSGRWGLENTANLGAVPPIGATLIVGAPKHENGTGGPSRAIALI